jgi:hypothetical protein
MINLENYVEDTDNSITFLPDTSSSINARGYDLPATKMAWLDKKHIKRALSLSVSPELLNIYNNSSDIMPDYDIVNAGIIFDHLNNKIATLNAQNADLEQRLKKYTNGENHKRYYEKNKEKIKETGASYLQKLKVENPEKIKEYSRQAYQNQKMKKLKKLAEEPMIL